MASSQSPDNGVFGQQDPTTHGSEFNSSSFLINQMLAKLQTTTLVQIVSVTNAGGVTPVGFVDVHPLVNQMSGDRKATPHGVIHNIPYFRLQGGGNAVILDPQVGDIGMCGFCSRDISSVKAAKAQGNPGSFRTFDWADGLYFGGMLNGAPTQYVQFSTAGITLHSPTAVTIDAPITTVTGDFMVLGKGTITKLFSYLAGLAGIGGSAGNAVTGNFTHTGGSLSSNGKVLDTHVHADPQGGNVGPPI